MQKLTVKEKRELYEQFKSRLDSNISVVDFCSAMERCKQKYANNYRKNKSKKVSERYQHDRYCDTSYNASDKKIKYNRDYQNKILCGEINPNCAEKVKSFRAYVNHRYGSLRNYHMVKTINKSKKESEDASI